MWSGAMKKKRKKKKKRFKVAGHTRGEERKGEELMIFLFN
jgi:hypothetical protein